MTVMEHNELGKEVASLDEHADDRPSRHSVITTDAVVDTYGHASTQQTLPVRRLRHEYLPRYTSKEPQEDSDVSSILSKERYSHKQGKHTQESTSKDTLFKEVPHSSYHFEPALTSQPHFSEPHFDVHNNYGAVYNFDSTHNLQIGRSPNMVVNVYGGSQGRNARREKKRYTITNSRKALNDENITMLSERLGRHWTDLARKLGFHSGDIDRLEYDNRAFGLKEVIFRMLFEWRDKLDHEATIRIIADALIDLKLYDIAQALKG